MTVRIQDAQGGRLAVDFAVIGKSQSGGCPKHFLELAAGPTLFIRRGAREEILPCSMA